MRRAFDTTSVVPHLCPVLFADRVGTTFSQPVILLRSPATMRPQVERIFAFLVVILSQFAKDYLRCVMTAYSQIQQLELNMATQLGHDQPLREEGSSYLAEVGAAIIQDGSHSAPKSRRLRLVERGEVDGLDYNDDEATERTPMPHLYPSPSRCRFPA